MSGRPPFVRSLATVFGTTLAVQAAAFARQVVVAAAFGIGRDMDLYALVLTVATATVFLLGNILDSVAIPRLIHAQDKPGAFRLLSGRLLGLSLLTSGVFTLLFAVGVPAMSFVVAAGLSDEERWRMLALAPAFVPWLLVCVPYYAMGSILKARSRYGRVFGAELVVVLTSLLCVMVAPHQVEVLPLSYAAGYLAGLAMLVHGEPIRPVRPEFGSGEMRGLVRNIVELLGAGQLGTVSSLVERFLQSFLATGSIAAWLYSSLLVNSAATLLTFRDVFIVPLSEAGNRGARLERVVIGLTMLALPAAGLMAVTAEPLVALLFGRGRFGADAVALASAYLQIQAIALWPSMVLSPMLRMLQIMDRIRLFMVVYAAGALALAAAGGLFVLVMGWQERGFALAWVFASAASCITAAVLLGLAGLRIDWRRIGLYSAYGLAVAGLAGGATLLLPRFSGLVPDLFARGAVFAGVVGLGYLAASRSLLAILR